MASYNRFNYNYRPAKSVERKIFVDLLRQIYGVKGIQDCEYIGLGSIYFSDFRLIHKELGLNRMVNIEAEIGDKDRFLFNVPYSCIKLKWGFSYDVLPRLNWAGKKIIWLDYDSSLQYYMFDDIDHIFSNLEAGSFYFMSCNSTFSRFFDSGNQSYKVDDFKESFPGLHPFSLSSEMLSNKNSASLIARMILGRIKHNLKLINSGKPKKERLRFVQLLNIVYKDGAPMVSIGGLLLKEKEYSQFKKTGTLKLPFVRIEGQDELNLEMPLLTNQEIDLLNGHLPSSETRFIKRPKIKFIPEDEKKKYLRAYRYFPSYVEVRDL